MDAGDGVCRQSRPGALVEHEADGRLGQPGTRGDVGDQAVLKLLAHPRRLIVTIILCNELVNIALSTQMATIGETAIARALGIHSPVWITALTIMITVPIVVLVGDMTPKTLAIKVGERWARRVAAICSCSARTSPASASSVTSSTSCWCTWSASERPATPPRGGHSMSLARAAASRLLWLLVSLVVLSILFGVIALATDGRSGSARRDNRPRCLSG